MLIFRIIIILFLLLANNFGYAFANPKLFQIKAFQVYRISNYLAYENNVKQICLVGDRTIRSGFTTFANRSSRISGAEIIDYNNYSDKMLECNIVYLSKKLGKGNIEFILKKLKPNLDRVITMSDYDNFIQNYGGTVEFFKVDNEYRFAINSYQKVKKSIIVSSKLMEAADRLY
ncbi:MAG: YfiR/HmsC family protein [Rickettsiales bacterium]|nr:YfiR/HmsC family protein [Rickettsiales bacterium]